jgi:hypothetical protein
MERMDGPEEMKESGAKERETAPIQRGASSRSTEWQLVQRVVSSSGFSKSALLTNFLLYVCDRKLHGCDDEITEQQIGVHALRRPSSYHPGEDNIVRNYARILRKRLDDYFENDGRDEPIRISIPRGSYIPVFEPNSFSQILVEPAMPSTIQDEVLNTPASVSTKPVRWLWLIASLAAVSCIVVGSIWIYLHTHNSARLYNQFWEEVFDPMRPSLVITADSGLALLEDLTGHTVHLQEYVSHDLHENFPELDVGQYPEAGSFGVDRFSNYTSTADLRIALNLVRLPQFVHARANVRYASEVSMDDMQHANAVLLGGERANPWVELYAPYSQFRMTFPTRLNGLHLDQKAIINEHPRAGERASYDNIWDGASHKTYTLISFLPNADHEGHVLLLQGENMAGTQAAGDFVLDRREMLPILRKAKLPDGSIGPFEILLETITVGASAPEAHPVVERYWGVPRRDSE